MPELLRVENHVKEGGPFGEDVPGFKVVHKANGLSRNAVKGRMVGRLTAKYPLKAGKIETLKIETLEQRSRRQMSDDIEEVEKLRERRKRRQEEEVFEDAGGVGANTWIVETFVPNESLGDKATEIIEDLVQRANEAELNIT